MKKKFIALSILTLLVLAGGIVGYNYLQSTYVVTVNYEHATDLKVIDISERQEGGEDKQLTTVANSGDKLRLAKDTSVIITYKGTDGYADGFVAPAPTEPVVTIAPDYSDAKNKAVAEEIRGDIQSAILAKYPTTKKYFSIGDCNLRDKATWCTVILNFTGSREDLDGDDLRILLHNTDNGWQLATKPDIILTTANYSNVPEAILSWANDF